MIANIKIAEKSFGDKELYKNLEIRIERGEKIGLIGRNGTGKSTLFNIVAGLDQDFDGEIVLGKGVTTVSSRQEHHGFENTTVLAYILEDLPEYSKLKHVLETYPGHMGEDARKLQLYSDSLERFTTLGYYEVENDVTRLLAAYQLEFDIANTTMGKLSGGQKRLVELVKVQRSRADLVLIDEPTNHMDYASKITFINWLKTAKEAVMVITHDRDVLGRVDRIIEIRDQTAHSFPGNYNQYLAQNAVNATSGVTEYENNKRTMANLKTQIRNARTRKLQAPPDQAKKWRILEDRLKRQYEKLEAATQKPTFWIDRESVTQLGTKMTESYKTHKARNMRVRTQQKPDRSERTLIKVDSLQLGYSIDALFDPVSFELRAGSKVRLHGRNGAGKTTLVQAILATVGGTALKSKVFAGHIEAEPQVRVGVYEQEIAPDYLMLTLGEAIEQVYLKKNVAISEEKIKQLLSDYLFNPYSDEKMMLSRLSGGQKARFQLINMLAGDPQVLILDEPTNHLDLPSVEELEVALSQYYGAILYISHDTYFSKNLAGEVREVTKLQAT